MLEVAGKHIFNVNSKFAKKIIIKGVKKVVLPEIL